MFEALTKKVSKAFAILQGKTSLSEKNLESILKEIRLALLSADVHFRIAKEFIETVKNKALGTKLIQSVSPAQHFTKIVHDEIVALLKSEQELNYTNPLTLMLVGLHGAGKTTTAAKLAHFLRKKDYIPALIACDVYRPAAIDQLETLAQQTNTLFFAQRENQNVPEIAQQSIALAKAAGANAFILDTAGRLQIDEPMMQELAALKHKTRPDWTLLIADAALGQEAVHITSEFHKKIQLDGIILSKFDGDARGGAALSMKQISGVPLRFLGTGEKFAELDYFYPERVAQRILGMGDVVSLVERAQEQMDVKTMEDMQNRMERSQFNLNDLLIQLKQIKKMGPLGSLLKMLPGTQSLSIGTKEEKEFKAKEAIISSMTPKERKTPQLLNASRRLRIASGSGTSISTVNQLLKQFQQMRLMMENFKTPKGKKAFEAKSKALGLFPKA